MHKAILGFLATTGWSLILGGLGGLAMLVVSGNPTGEEGSIEVILAMIAYTSKVFVFFFSGAILVALEKLQQVASALNKED